MYPDLNQLWVYDFLARLPYPQPRFWPYAPLHEPMFAVHRDVASQMGATTLDTYVAPRPPAWRQDLGQTAAIPGNGIVLYGNAPTSGVYTGVQAE